jgi:hypothetical protein
MPEFKLLVRETLIHTYYIEAPSLSAARSAFEAEGSSCPGCTSDEEACLDYSIESIQEVSK